MLMVSGGACGVGMVVIRWGMGCMGADSRGTALRALRNNSKDVLDIRFEFNYIV